MPSKEFGTIWPAEHHTLAKITILEAYLYVWLQIMGRSMTGADILYIDGFAGPGEYTNSPKGSPVAALSAAQKVLQSFGVSWKAGTIHCAFIESDEKRFQHLEKVISRVEAGKRIKLYKIQKSFCDGLAEIKKEIPRSFIGSTPLFVFIDPFGATGAPFSVVADILKSPTSEVLINFDADGIARIYRAENAANSAVLLDEIFGNQDWKRGLAGISDFNALCRQVLRLYRQSLRRLSKVRYDFAFEMRTHANSLNYYLVFASQHPLGLEKMKEAMKKVDQTGTYQFADANVDQPCLFRFDQPENYSHFLLGHFKGKTTRYEELRDFALNETPFINPKAMLKKLETNGLISVYSHDPKRKKGTFNEGKIDRIVFKGSE